MEPNKAELLRIAGIAEWETAWSNIYAYYIDPQNEPRYASAFTNALLQLCGLNRSEVLPDDNYYVRTEVPTYNRSTMNESGRIDILIKGAKSIIIENKINHILNNPLNEYWDYATNPAVLIVLSVARISEHILSSYCRECCRKCNELQKDENRIKCVNITHYDLITRTKEILGKEFESPILKELENIIAQKTIIMPDNLYIRDNEERLEINRIFEQEYKRRQMIAKECMELEVFERCDSGHRNSGSTSIIQFKSCPNNNWVHYRYRGQDDLVIGVMCAYLWDWERYEKDSKLRIIREGQELIHTPVITLFVQVHGNLYRKMKQEKEDLVVKNGYDIPGKYCHVYDYDIDMSNVPENINHKGGLASFLTAKLLDRANCKVLEIAKHIYNGQFPGQK